MSSASGKMGNNIRKFLRLNIVVAIARYGSIRNLDNTMRLSSFSQFWCEQLNVHDAHASHKNNEITEIRSWKRNPDIVPQNPKYNHNLNLQSNEFCLCKQLSSLYVWMEHRKTSGCMQRRTWFACTQIMCEQHLIISSNQYPTYVWHVWALLSWDVCLTCRHACAITAGHCLFNTIGYPLLDLQCLLVLLHSRRSK